MVQINDRYEFPLTLDLDRENGKYLSPNADRSVRNLYTLHRLHHLHFYVIHVFFPLYMLLVPLEMWKVWNWRIREDNISLGNTGKVALKLIIIIHLET